MRRAVLTSRGSLGDRRAGGTLEERDPDRLERGCDISDYTAYQSAELAELYDAVYDTCDDIAFWKAMAGSLGEGPILELASGTGRLLLPLARAGFEVTGIDIGPSMLARCRGKLQAEAPEVRDRVTLLEADMTAFSLEGRFAQIYCAFGSFHHLRTVDQQLDCLQRCRSHLLPGGKLVLDLINPDPAPTVVQTDSPAAAGMTAGLVEWTDGRRVRSWASVVDTHRALQCNDCEITYEITEVDGSTRTLSETLPMRFVFRFELEHLLARSGFRIVSLFGDYDRSAFADASLGMIVVAEVSE
ncbi:MAG TPA: class I SAM-dependent methyltransferase [Coriobacteriia bacterium]|nr:class I SAM-dependent methyltransferase [Coriobacteriia bacterium]